MPLVYYTIIFFAPSFIANLSFNVFYEIKRYFKIQNWDRPLDCNIMIRQKRVLGESTTIGGLGVAIIMGILLSTVPIFSDTIIKSLLAYFGHAAGSFLKRRMGMERGEYAPIIDHGDYMIITSLFFIFSEQIDISVAIIGTAAVLIVQPIITWSAWKIGIREAKI
jgi:CDP-2,3-bis-(O-geranylgeranyl)-sn-glycerol synthase